MVATSYQTISHESGRFSYADACRIAERAFARGCSGPSAWFWSKQIRRRLPPWAAWLSSGGTCCGGGATSGSRACAAGPAAPTKSTGWRVFSLAPAGESTRGSAVTKIAERKRPAGAVSADVGSSG